MTEMINPTQPMTERLAAELKIKEARTFIRQVLLCRSLRLNETYADVMVSLDEALAELDYAAKRMEEIHATDLMSQ